MPSVVILGANYTGVTIAHKLLKNTLPKVKDLKVTIVTPSTHLFWNLAMVRHILPKEYACKDEEIFVPLAKGFEKYPKGSYEFVYGLATSVNDKENKVTVQKNGGAGTEDVSYDYLVVATGSKYKDQNALKASDQTYEATLASVNALREKVTAAKSIVIGGAGPTGVEIAAELGSAFGKKKEVTLITSADQVIPPMRKDIAKTAEDALSGWGVNIVKGVTVQSANQTSEGYELTLSDGKKLNADFYLPTAGVRANAGFMPEAYRTENGVKVDQFLKAQGSENIYAAGDVADLETKQIAHAEAQALALSGILDAVLQKKQPKPYKADPKTVLFVALGKQRGVAQMGNWKFPQFLVVMFKSKTLITERNEKLVGGINTPMGGKF